MLTRSASLVPAERHMCLRGAAVLDDVVQPFLDDAEQAELPRRVTPTRHAIVREMHLNALRQHFATMPADGRHEAEGLQLRRVQAMGKIVDLGRNLRRPFAELAHGPRHRRRRPTGFIATCSISIESSAICWLRLSCSSRAIRRRSSSWADSRRPLKLWSASSARRRRRP